jgi:hypothetical protein
LELGVGNSRSGQGSRVYGPPDGRGYPPPPPSLHEVGWVKGRSARYVQYVLNMHGISILHISSFGESKSFGHLDDLHLLLLYGNDGYFVTKDEAHLMGWWTYQLKEHDW